MRRFVLSVVAAVLTLGGLTLLTASAKAQDPYHDRYHDQLEHRDYHRYLDHRDAHRYPMTWGQHDRLHDELNHDAYHDRLEHRQSHRQYDQYSPYQSNCPPYPGYSYYPQYSGYGLGYQGRNFSFYYGR